MMQRIDLPKIDRILCIGAHADDIEIGCGGTLLRLLEERPQLSVLWVIATCDDVRRSEAKQSAATFLKRAAVADVQFLGFRDGYLPYLGPSVKDSVFSVGEDFLPDLVFTHRLEDRHQDHRLLSELTWNTFRDQVILEYEIPKYEGDLGQPNFMVQLTRNICEQKISALLSSYPTQAEKSWFDAETFWALLRLRGLEINAKTKYAEAFTARKLCI